MNPLNKKLNKRYSELTREELGKLYNAFCCTYRDKYLDGYVSERKGNLSIYKYFELFGVEEFVLDKNTEKYIL